MKSIAHYGDNLRKWLVAGSIIVLSFTIIAALFILYNIPSLSPVDYSYKGIGIGYPISTGVDESLKPYIKVTSGGQGHSQGAEGWMVLNGTVSWIGSPQDSIKSLSDIHLVMYTKVDERTYINGSILTHVFVGVHLEALPNELKLSNDTIDHSEVIIPMIGLDMPTYPYSLNCSTSISQQDADGLSNASKILK